MTATQTAAPKPHTETHTETAPQHGAGPTYTTLDVDRDGPVATVRLNRPDALNAMNRAFFAELPAAFRALGADTSVRAIVLAGEGRHFTAGLDLKDTSNVIGDRDGDAGRVRERFLRHVKHLQASISAVEECPVPVIAAVHGACIGGGVDLVSACDIRLATADAFFSIKEIDIGIVADIGTFPRILRLLPDGIVKELAYTGRKFPAGEAAARGFVNHVHETRDEVVAHARDIAADIAAKTPLAIAGIKNVLNYQRDHSVRDGLDYVAVWNSAMLMGEDLMKAATATMTKTSVDFADRLPDAD